MSGPINGTLARRQKSISSRTRSVCQCCWIVVGGEYRSWSTEYASQSVIALLSGSILRRVFRNTNFPCIASRGRIFRCRFLLFTTWCVVPPRDSVGRFLASHCAAPIRDITAAWFGHHSQRVGGIHRIVANIIISI